jgi:DNA-binding XRE family transcriptional regulator
MARKSSSTTIDTSFEEVDDILDGIDVDDSALARINERLATLFDGDDALRSIRTLCGVAQKDVAADVGVTASAVAQLESRDLDNAQLGTVRRYFAALGYELQVGVVPIAVARRSKRGG